MKSPYILFAFLLPSLWQGLGFAQSPLTDPQVAMVDQDPKSLAGTGPCPTCSSSSGDSPNQKLQQSANAIDSAALLDHLKREKDRIVENLQESACPEVKSDDDSDPGDDDGPPGGSDHGGGGHQGTGGGSPPSMKSGDYQKMFAGHLDLQDDIADAQQERDLRCQKEAASEKKKQARKMVKSRGRTSDSVGGPGGGAGGEMGMSMGSGNQGGGPGGQGGSSSGLEAINLLGSSFMSIMSMNAMNSGRNNDSPFMYGASQGNVYRYNSYPGYNSVSSLYGSSTGYGLYGSTFSGSSLYRNSLLGTSGTYGNSLLGTNGLYTSTNLLSNSTNLRYSINPTLGTTSAYYGR